MKSKGISAVCLVLMAVGLFPLLGSGRGEVAPPGESEKDPTAIFSEMKALEKRQRALIEKLIPDGETVQMTFPVGGERQTAWKVTWHIDRHKNEIGNQNQWFAIKEAWYKTGPTADWIKVLGDARVSELFTPYEVGDPRYLDMKQFRFPIIKLTPKHTGPNGRLLGNGMVVAEIRDRGPMWSTNSFKGAPMVRRGQDLVLWAVLQAGNYHFVIQYGFQDDGVVTFRVGSTGANLPHRKDVGHMHNACWRVNLDLGGEGKNNVYVVRHLEDKNGNGKASHKEELFNGGLEGGIDWKPREFTMLRFKHKLTSEDGKSREVAYDMMPFRYGTTRHYGSGEGFSHHDFWVTPFDEAEQYYYNVHKYVKKNDPPRSIQDTKVTLWYMSSAHHQPRLEDGYNQPRVNGAWGGITLLMWTGFDLKPRNLFTKTPLYP